MRILFTTHTTGYGGAAISLTTNLKHLIENGELSAKDCVIAVPTNERDLKGGAYHWFEGRVPFKFWHMPFSTAYKGGSEQIHAKVYSILKESISILFFLGVYNHLIKKERITHIHLNSMVFWAILPFLPKDICKIIHVREMITDDISGHIVRRVINKYADTIIAISRQTAVGLPRSEIIENPYDMYTARKYRNVRAELKSNLGIPQDSFIVSVFAPIGKQKGSDFLLKATKKIPEDLPVHFILVGHPFRGEQILYRDLSKTPNVHIFPASTNMDKFYAITDIVLRCEGYLPLGRTVYEGIYAGCIALLPISYKDTFGEIIPYLDQISTYSAGDPESFYSAFMGIYRNHKNGVYDNGFDPTGNVETSARNLLKVITK